MTASTNTTAAHPPRPQPQPQQYQSQQYQSSQSPHSKAPSPTTSSAKCTTAVSSSGGENYGRQQPSSFEFTSQSHPSLVPWLRPRAPIMDPAGGSLSWPTAWHFAVSRRFSRVPHVAEVFSMMRSVDDVTTLTKVVAHLAPEVSGEDFRESLYQGMVAQANSDGLMRDILLETLGARDIIFKESHGIWGVGEGTNELGKLVLRLRDKFYPKRKALLCNFDNTVNLQSVVDLLRAGARQSHLSIDAVCQYLHLSSYKSILSSEFSGGPYDLATLCLNANETRLSINEPDSSGIGFGPFYRKLRRLTNNQVAVIISGDSTPTPPGAEVPLSLWVWEKIMSQFPGTEIAQVDGRQGIVMSWGSQYRSVHIHTVAQWLALPSEPVASFQQLFAMSINAKHRSSVPSASNESHITQLTREITSYIAGNTTISTVNIAFIGTHRLFLSMLYRLIPMFPTQYSRSNLPKDVARFQLTEAISLVTLAMCPTNFHAAVTIMPCKEAETSNLQKWASAKRIIKILLCEHDNTDIHSLPDTFLVKQVHWNTENSSAAVICLLRALRAALFHAKNFLHQPQNQQHPASPPQQQQSPQTVTQQAAQTMVQQPKIQVVYQQQIHTIPIHSSDSILKVKESVCARLSLDPLQYYLGDSNAAEFCGEDSVQSTGTKNFILYQY
ncbi:hypothetical protein Pelo_7162 [Pelomyxa schiedti]|nr:hypothetical protein Pelo_7162 [Pelomyxa schiedti]